MQNGDQNEKQSGNVLAEALTKFGNIQTQIAKDQAAQADSANKRIDKLSDRMGDLVEIIARSEERHNTHTEKNGRLEKNQIDLGKEFKDYRMNNDERVVNIEKQVLLLDQSEKKSEKAQQSKNTIRNTVIGSVLSFMALALLALVFAK